MWLRAVFVSFCFAAICASPRVAAQSTKKAAAASEALSGQDLARDVDRKIAGAAAWLASLAIESEHGLRWPQSSEIQSSETQRKTRVARSLYSGSPGVVLFFALFAEFDVDEERRARWRDLAKKGAAQLVHDLEDESWKDAGSYTGLAGTAFVVDELARRWQDRTLASAVDGCIVRLAELAKSSEGGMRWSSVTDIISGSAGTGLFLLHCLDRSRKQRSDRAVETAERLARGIAKDLASRAIATEHGKMWRMAPGYRRDMPNFSHGTAGVSFFFARAHEVLGEASAGALAQQGLAELRARTQNGLIEHHRPGGEALFYLGWCHGPVGVDNLYRQLGAKASSRDAMRALLASGIPETRTPGFWVNHGVCCGTAGLLGFAQSRGHRALAERSVRAILRGSRQAGKRVSWSHAEHRARPKLLSEQCAWMQGASGIAVRLLQWRHSELRLLLPDETGRPAPR